MANWYDLPPKWEILYQWQRALLEAEKKQEEDLLRLIKEERVRLNLWDENEFGTECP